MKSIRNFSIIAHIDHGKSTLSDRIIQICDGLSDREMGTQVPDSTDFECERGITIKTQSVALDFKAFDGEACQLNFIDTLGHADFLYEVSRSLTVCEGALSMANAGQGVEMQILVNCYTVMEVDLEVISALNKVDLPAADSERVVEEIEDIVSVDATGAARCSAKIDAGVTNTLERLIRGIPPSEGDPEGPLQVLIIDSWLGNYLGVVSLVRIRNGAMHKGDKIKVMSTGRAYNVDRLGIFTPRQVDRTELECGGVSWLVCMIKDILDVPAGDTLTQACNPTGKLLPGSKRVKSQVYAGLFPMNSDNHEGFRDVLGKLSLNDASLFCELESSTTLGPGFRCGSLGLLHMEVIQECLKREYDLDLIATTPAVAYKVETTAKEIIYVDSPSKLPPLNNIYELREPIAECHTLLPQVYLGSVITLCTRKRGVQTNMVYHDNQVALTCEVPMAEVALDFSDRLKSTSRGYVSPDYNFKCFQASDMVRADVPTNNEHVDALALITHRNNFQSRGRELVEEMEGLIPHQQFDIAIQAATGAHIIARSTVKQPHRDVLMKCYGGDISHKKKLLQKQGEGKRRMKQTGDVELPQEALLAILYVGKDSE